MHVIVVSERTSTRRAVERTLAIPGVNITPLFFGTARTAGSSGVDAGVALLDVEHISAVGALAERDALRARWSGMRVIAARARRDRPGAVTAADLLRHGFDGYLAAGSDDVWPELPLAIRLADAGYTFAPRGDATGPVVLAAPAVPQAPEAGARVPPLASLTAREEQVVGLMLEGATTKQIARSLAVTRSTAQSHISHVLAKLGCADRAQAVLVLSGGTAPAAPVPPARIPVPAGPATGTTRTVTVRPGPVVPVRDPVRTGPGR